MNIKQIDLFFMVEGKRYGDLYCDFIKAKNKNHARRKFTIKFGNEFSSIKVSRKPL